MRRELTLFDRKWIKIAKAVLACKGPHMSGMPKSEAREVLCQFGIKH
jgi:hypothetical protein